MLFSDLLKNENLSEQNAFLLWMIYEWPILLDNNSKIIAYSSFKPEAGWESWNAMTFLRTYNRTKEYYNDLHFHKLLNFLWEWYDIQKNDTINQQHNVSNNRQIWFWVSVIFDFDLVVPEWIRCENYVLWVIEKWLIDIEDNYKNMFFTWAIDARCSLDFNHSFATIDLEKKKFPELCRRKMNKYSDIIWTICNYNPRLTQWESSSNKNDQFRINLQYFVWHFWFFSPFRIGLYEFITWTNLISNDEYFYKDNRYFDKELNVNVSSRNIWINNLAIELKQQWLSEDDKKIIIDRYRVENLIDDNDDEILHSSQNVKESAKIRDWYKCMFDQNHITFNARNWKNYVEAHHLIPFSERNNFDLSIDIVENIVCLCPNCHRKIHLAIDEQKKELLNPLFERKHDELSNAWIDLNLNELYHYYWIN